MNIPEKVINRLTLYHFILDDCAENEENISSNKLSELLNIDNSQVRKDIKYVNYSGKCHVGYEIKTLKKAIELALGFQNPKKALIVGAGNLGTALSRYDNFACYGLDISAMFDSDSSKVGKTIAGKEIFHISKISGIAKEESINIAILTVPKSVAQSVTDILVDSGIKYIWNFTPCVLKTPTDVKVWNENLIGHFLQFTQNN